MLNLIFLGIKAFADLPAVAPTPQQAPPTWMQFVPLVFILVVMYFVVLRPQAKKQKETESFLSALRVGDQVVTQSGILGRITSLSDSIATLEIANQVQMKILRSHILMSQAALQSNVKKEEK